MRHRIGRFARIAIGAALLAGPMASVAVAQDMNRNDTATRTDTDRGNRMGDMGWLGLIGLAGLLGLRGRDRSKTYTASAQAPRHA